MKVIIALFVFFISFLHVNAQTSKGWLYASGGGSFFTGSQENADPNVTTDDRLTRISGTPTVGIFAIDGLMVGATLNFTREKLTNKQDDTVFERTISLGAGPVIRYYHISDFFVFASTTFGSSKETTSLLRIGETTVESSWFGSEAGLGRAFFLNEFVAVEPMVLYSYGKFTNKEDSAIYQIEDGIAFRLAISVFLE